MKRFVLALAALLMGASPALADTTRYVDKVNGSDSYDGTSATHTTGTSTGPWQTLSHCNTGAGGSSSVHLPQPNTANGNVILMIAPGTYTSMFKPDTVATNWKRYFLMGNIANPAATLINAGHQPSLSDSSISIHGITIDYGLSVGSFSPAASVTAKYDSVIDCVVQQGDLNVSQAYHCILARCSFPQAKALRIGYDSDDLATSLRKTVGFQMHDCTFPALWSDWENPITVGIANDKTFTKRQLVDSLLWRNCTIDVTARQSTSDPECFRFYYTTNATLDHCHINIHQNNTTDNESGVPFAIRDSSVNFTLNADTIRCDGPGKQIIMLSHAGNIPNTVRGGVVDSCWLSNSGGTSELVRYQNGMKGVTFTYNTLSTAGPYALMIPDSCVGPNHIEHNTFAGHSGPSRWVRGIVYFAQGDGNAPFATDTTRFYSNIIYNDWPPVATVLFDTNSDLSSTSCGLFFPIGQPNATNLFKSEWNAYEFMPYRYSLADRSIGWCCYGSSAPGATNTFKSNFPATHRVADSLSVSGDLQLGYGAAAIQYVGLDSAANGYLYSLPVSGPALDPHIGALSVARGISKDSTDAGAVAYDSSPTAVMSGANAAVVRLTYQHSSTVDSLFTIKNAGTGTMTVSVAVGGFNSASFSITPTSYSLTHNQKKTFSLTWTSPYPTPPQGGTNTIVITTNDPALPTIRIPVVFDDAISSGQQ